MRILHLSDLHLGKRVNEFSMLEDQEYILMKIINIIDETKPDAVVIAGDVYDKTIPPVEAVELFDDFLVRLAKRKINVFVISGNHDSAERISFGGRLMENSGVFMSPVYQGTVDPVVLNDEYGELCIYLLPFIKPAHVRRFYPDQDITSYNDALQTALDAMHIDTDQRNVLVTHQFVTGAMTSDSEELSVGGTDHVDVSVFDGFDYVALGHLHRAQKCGKETVRYSGTPLKYSFSEANDHKSVTLIDFYEKGNVNIQLIPLVPKRDLVELKGSYEELTLKSFYENTTYTNDYVHITLTDEQDIVDVLMKLRVIYKNIMKLDYDNHRTRHHAQINGTMDVKSKSHFEHFSDFYEMQNGQALNDDQISFVKEIMDEIWRDDQ